MIFIFGLGFRQKVEVGCISREEAMGVPGEDSQAGKKGRPTGGPSCVEKPVY